MAQLKFYEDERLRWPELHNIDITDSWAKRALKKLTRHFKLDALPYGHGPISLKFAGRSTSWGGQGGITLAKSRDWLVFLHEVAHVWEYRKHGQTEHRRRMAKLVDRICRYAVKMKWAEQDLEEQFTAFCAQQADEEITEVMATEAEKGIEPESFSVPWVAERREPDGSLTLSFPGAAPEPARFAFAAQPAAKDISDAQLLRQQRLDKKRRQLKRLETKIKSLTTRVKKLRRSIQGLERHTSVASDDKTR